MELKSSGPAGNSRLKHIPELDGIRGIAAIAVFFHHLAYTSIQPQHWNAAIGWLHSFSRYGLYGVDLFFVLSGYLITSLLLQDRESNSYYHNFYWKRALRILPIYLLSLLAVWIWIPGTTGGVILSLFFLANFTLPLHVNIGGPYWSLAIEEQFYLIWPRFIRRFPVETIQKIALGIVIAVTALRLIATAFGHFDFILTFFRCDGLAWGAVLACQCHRARNLKKFRGNYKTNLKNVGLFVVSLVFLVLSAQWLDSPRFYMQGSALFLSAVSLFFYVVIRIAVENSGLRPLYLLRSRLFVFFGEISYCMYMSHTFVMQIYDHYTDFTQSGDSFLYLRRITIVLAITIVLCVISRYTLELPVQSLRRYVLRPSNQRLPAKDLSISDNVPI